MWEENKDLYLVGRRRRWDEKKKSIRKKTQPLAGRRKSTSRKHPEGPHPKGHGKRMRKGADGVSRGFVLS